MAAEAAERTVAAMRAGPIAVEESAKATAVTAVAPMTEVTAIATVATMAAAAAPTSFRRAGAYNTNANRNETQNKTTQIHFCSSTI